MGQLQSDIAAAGERVQSLERDMAEQQELALKQDFLLR